MKSMCLFMYAHLLGGGVASVALGIGIKQCVRACHAFRRCIDHSYPLSSVYCRMTSAFNRDQLLIRLSA